MEVLVSMACMDDDQFVFFAALFGFTRKPDPDGETMGNFRMRVVDALL